MQTKVTVITVSYNSGRTLQDTIHSVLKQTYPNIEYIIIDGGSKDNSTDIIRTCAPLFEGRIKWISEPDKGIYDAMNKGIALASGEVVGFLNSDDYFTSEDIIEKVAEAFSDQTLDAVYGDVHFIRDGKPERCVRYYSSRRFRPCWLRFGFMPAHPSFYARKTVYGKTLPYKTDYPIGADYEMMVRLFCKHHIKARYLNMDFVTMRTGGASTRGVRSMLTLISDDIRACKENGIYTNTFMISLKFFYKIFGIMPWNKR